MDNWVANHRMTLIEVYETAIIKLSYSPPYENPDRDELDGVY
jgi:hypothetical protein